MGVSRKRLLSFMKKIQPFVPLIKWGIGAVVVIMLAFVISATPPVHSFLRTLRVVPEPERLTELYFDPTAPPPATYRAGQPFNVRFHIHNLEEQSVPYTYEVRLANERGDNSALLSQQQVTLQNNENKTISLSVTPPDMGSNAKIEITIRYNRVKDTHSGKDPKNTSINYWIKEES